MRTKTAFMFLAALVFAGLASFLAYGYLKSHRQIEASVMPDVTMGSDTVVIATKDLKAGDRLSKDALTEIPWPGALLPSGTFKTVAELSAEDSGTLLIADVRKGEAIISAKLQRSGSPSPLASQLKDGKRAISIRVAEDTGVGGFVQPGDSVDVLLTRTGTGGEGGTKQEASTMTLLQNVTVIAVDQSTQRREKLTPPKIVTLELSAFETQKLTLAGYIGQISLVLTRKGEANTETIGAVTIEDLLESKQSRSEREIETGPTVTVTRAVERKEYKVKPEKK